MIDAISKQRRTLTSIFFWLLVVQGIIFIFYIVFSSLFFPETLLSTTYLAQIQALLGENLAGIFLFAISFIFLITGLAFVILPADLIYEKVKDEMEKFISLASMLFLPWLDFAFNLIANPDFLLSTAILKTAVLMYVGGIIPYLLGIAFILGGIKIGKLNGLATLILIIAIAIPLIWFAYAHIFCTSCFNSTIGIVSWHVSLLIYSYSVFSNLRHFSD